MKLLETPYHKFINIDQINYIEINPDHHYCFIDLGDGEVHAIIPLPKDVELDKFQYCVATIIIKISDGVMTNDDFKDMVHRLYKSITGKAIGG